MSIKLTRVAIFLLCSSAVQAGRWFDFRMLRNAGLVTGNASTSDECINSCLQTSKCSAVSYQPSSRICLTSMCNNLDLYPTTGWNTYVIDWEGVYVEGSTVPAPQFEWMLTDSCGNTNQARSSGPKMNLYNVAYAPSLSASAGNAAVFAGNFGSYGVTDSDSRLYNPMGKVSLSVSMWVKWYNATPTTFHEYSVENSNRGIIFWLWNGGLFNDVRSVYGTTCAGSCSETCCYNVNTFTPVINTWYHVAFVYDGAYGSLNFYLNSTLVTNVSTGIFSNSLVWTRVRVAFSTFDARGALNGQLYCHKVHNVALTSEQLAATATSCSAGKIRFS